MTIRQSKIEDLASLMEIFAYARGFMANTGNPNQWINGYPSEELIRQEIEAGHCFICLNEEGKAVGTFCFILGDDPTYSYIEEGAWLNNDPYGTIHRLASNGTEKGVFGACLKWCAARCKNLRADTYCDNHIVQSLLERNGFRRCGIIYIANGTPRIAYQKEV